LSRLQGECMPAHVSFLSHFLLLPLRELSIKSSLLLNLFACNWFNTCVYIKDYSFWTDFIVWSCLQQRAKCRLKVQFRSKILTFSKSVE
jgi:hypothetical protein